MSFRHIVLGCLPLFTAGLANAELITNGSFENVTGTTVDNWVLTPTASSGATSDYPTATGTSPFGPRFLSFNFGLNVPGGSATQDFGTTDFDTTYVLSFNYAAIGTTGPQTLGVTINATSVPIPQQVFIDDTPSTDFSTMWNSASIVFQGNQLPTGVTFADLGVTLLGDSDLLVDNVSIVAVPEPAMTALLALSTTAALLRRRRLV